MQTFVYWVGMLVCGAATVAAVVGIFYAAAYWTTYWINESHHRIAETIAGNGYLEKLRQAVENDPTEPPGGEG